MKRASVKVASELDAAHSSEPATKMPMAVRKHGAGAETVGEPAAHGDEHAEPEHVARDGDLERDRIAAEVARHRRQGGHDHIRIDTFHEHRARDDERGKKRFLDKCHG